jgi:hypothetical protein
MLDASKYAQHFPDEEHQSGAPETKPASPKPRPSLLAALSQLEKEFREILRTQADTADPAD